MNGDLISRSALIKEICKDCRGVAEGWCDGPNGTEGCTTVSTVRKQPAAESEIKTRCKECMAWERCPVAKRLGEDGFCSAGKRRGEDG